MLYYSMSATKWYNKIWEVYMGICINTSAIHLAINLLKKKRVGELKRRDAEMLLNHADYKFELDRYGGRISKEEFLEYFLNFENLKAAVIKNADLRLHHSYWLDLYQNIEWYEKKANEFFNHYDQNAMEDAFRIAAGSFPKDFKLGDYRIVVTCGMGPSYGYSYGDGIHFDLMQLFREHQDSNFKLAVAHELHHMIFFENIELDRENIESYFLQWLAVEGLATKFTHNLEGVISMKLHADLPANMGLDEPSIAYLNSHFDDYFKDFKQALASIRNGTIYKLEDVQTMLYSYWFDLYMEGQGEDEEPRLKQPKLYTVGADLWATIYDAYGMNVLYETVRHPEGFVEKYNDALEKLGKQQYKIDFN